MTSMVEMGEQRWVRTGNPDVVLWQEQFPILYGGGRFPNIDTVSEMSHECQIRIERRYAGEDWKTIATIENGHWII